MSNLRSFYLSLFAILFGLSISSGAWSACDISGIISMADEGKSLSDVRQACETQVLEVGTCSLARVYRLYDGGGYDESEIQKECTNPASPDGNSKGQGTVCVTSQGTCNGQGARGSVCQCWGRAIGRIQ